MLNIKAFLDSLTTHPGVYQMLGDDGKVLYVGKARNLKKRISSYFSNKQKDNKTFAMVKHIKDINVTVTHSETDAILLECNLIKKYKPHYNVLFRDDKSFPYITITLDTPYPCIEFYRGSKKKDKFYFGPYPNASAVRETIHLIQKLFGIRTCNDRYHPNRTRPCLQYQMGLCSGSCAGLISKEDYQQDVQHAMLFLQGKNAEVLQELEKKMEIASKQLNYEIAAKLRDQILQLRAIQARQHVSAEHGDVDVIGFAYSGIACIQLLIVRSGRILGSRAYFPILPPNASAEVIISSFLSQHYLGLVSDGEIYPKEIVVDFELPDKALLAKVLSEQADKKIKLSHNVRGERKKWLEIANASAQQSISSQLLSKTNMQQRITALRTALENQQIKRIECFDISHTMGESTVASCVVFNTEGPLKSDYRRFNIKEITPGDDIAAMQQALQRRYSRLLKEEAKFPDLILIDGGVAQLNIAQNILQELHVKNVQLMSVSKGTTRKPGFETLHFIDKNPIHLNSDSLALHLIQQIRDEAHRFAITGHRQQRDKKRKTSTLETIPGIGAGRRRELLRYFGGIQAINRASLEELAKVPGISQSLAERIFAALHNK